MSLKSRFNAEILLERPGFQSQRPDHEDPLCRRERTNVLVVLRIVQPGHPDRIAGAIRSLLDSADVAGLLRWLHGRPIVARGAGGTSIDSPLATAGTVPVTYSDVPPAVRCRGLEKTYDAKPPVEAVRGLDLEIAAGECFGLLGPNGAGKTTTIEILEGILEPTAGEVDVLGLRWEKDERDLRQRIGVTLQETKFTDKLTVEETLRLFGSFYERGRPAADVMAEVELVEKRASWVGNLSGGQRQRLAVACALVGDPDLLFLDEPTTGLDPQSRRQLWDIIRELRRRGRTILLTTHYMDEAERLCDRVAVVDHGKVIALGSPSDLIRSLGGDHVVEFALDSAAGDGGVELESLRGLPSVRSARTEGDAIQLTVAEPHVAIPALLERLAGSRPLSRLSTRHASLEDVFVSLTGRHLREE
jgi:ABC-2 type transport system ATP-binding protein